MIRTLRKHFTSCLAGSLFLLAGCTDEELYTPRPVVEEGIPTRVTLSYKVKENMVITRAAIDAEYEFRVENLYVFVFDSNGNRIWTTDDNNNRLAFFSENSGLENVHNGNGTTADPSTGSATFTVTSVNNARIVGIANLTSDATETAYNVPVSEMDAINTLQDLQEKVLQMNNASIERGSLFLMTGYAETTGPDGQPTTDITISGVEGGTTALDCTLLLQRTDAKVEVIVTSEKANNGWTNFSFEPQTWQVLRVPKRTLLLPYEKDGCKGPWEDAEALDWDAGRLADESTNFYFDTQARPFEKMTETEVDNTKYYTGGSFVFYMPENRKHYKEQITETGNQGYALRDESNTQNETDPSKPGQEYTNTDFKYAADDATYLLLTGHLSYTDTENYEVNADVRYIIHLGYATNDPNDYDTKRNGHYTYNVKVKGINNIVVEVTDRNEVRPGHEGDVVYSTNTIFELDSHFDRCLLEIVPDKVTDQLTWGIKTPFSSGIHPIGSTSYTGIEDYKWIKFAINALHNTPHGEYVKYPGNDKYNPNLSGTPSDADASGLLDIDQLIAYLKKVKAEDEGMSNLIPSGSNHVCITAFVDENLYFTDPITGEDKLELWRESVDREDRQLHIIVPFEEGGSGEGNIVYSPDGASSVVNSLYTFTQKAIRTVFDVNNENLKTAWGLESVMEELEGSTGGRLPVGNNNDLQKGTDTRNGRLNTLAWAEGKTWSQIVDASKRYQLRTAYQNAAYACLLRNRDLDGDDIVDKDEVRWYLASIDQLTDIFLGEYALDEASRLYTDNRPGGNSVYWHYTSSSWNSNDNGPWVLWAEEGASRGSYGDSSKPGMNGTRYAYRCIRNLGIELTDTNTDPEDLVIVNDNGDGSYTIDMSRMNPKARRTNREVNPLPIHNERDAENRPYTKFIVGKDAYPEDRLEPVNGREATWIINETTEDQTGSNWINQHEWAWYQTSNPCPTGYRIPNQRELLIMTSRMNKEQWPSYSVEVTYHEWVGEMFGSSQERTKTIGDLRPEFYISQTAFSMDGQAPYNTQRDGFLWSSKGDVFMLQNNTDEKGYVRCVRDTD